MARLPGTYEKLLINQLSDDFPHVTINKVEQFTLVNKPKVTATLQSLPGMFALPPTMPVIRPKWALTMNDREVNH